ncbi:MAG: mechanosensitive ion channel [Paramuribaculum sp.]|nr:mechanosensitive ion channel [Paramuribaculum sp.]MDE6782204.1 mechanosensitive ion channel [Paramuribaculum sp.]
MIFLQSSPILTDSIPAATKREETVQMLKSLSLEDFITKFAHTLVDFAFHLAVAILVFYLGRFIIRRMYAFVAGVLGRRKVDSSLTTFILSLVRIVLYFILVVTVIGILGINTSSFIALFASAGVAIGMALSGTLQNFAGGVLILLLKPYKVGDYIEAQGFAGRVSSIQIFSTVINTYDNKSIIIPNGGLSTGTINNWSKELYRRIDWNISISYSDDVESTRKAILDMLHADSDIVQVSFEADIERRNLEKAQEEKAAGIPAAVAAEPKRHGWLYRLFHRSKKKEAEPLIPADFTDANPVMEAKLKENREPAVVVSSLADSAVILTVRAWALADDYWKIYYRYNEAFFTTLPKKGVHFPFPQLDVHLDK